MQRFENIFESRQFPAEWQSREIALPFSMGRVETVKPFCLSRKNLPLYLLLYTCSGVGKLKYNNREYTLEKGNVIFINCYDEHEYSAISEKWNFCFVHLNLSAALSAYYNEITKNGKNVLFFYPPFYNDCYLKLFEYTEKFKNTTYIKASRNILDTILSLGISNVEAVPPNIKEAAEFINENFALEITIKDLCEISNVSKYYFIRSFKRYYNTTPYDYVVFCRINKAKLLLLESNKSIEEISEECGFSSIGCFSRAFKDKVGFSPLNFRKGLRII